MKLKYGLFALAVVFALGGALATPISGLAKAETAKTNVVIDWNHTMLAAFAANTPLPIAAPAAPHYAAIVQSAVFDAVNGIDRRYTPIRVAPAAPRGASREAAAVSAAYTALKALFPAQTASLDAARAASMATLEGDDEDGQSIANGVQWGETVADQIVNWRSTDGFSATPPPYTIGNAPGDWKPTPPAPSTATPVFRQLATTTPFAMTSPSQFRPGGPPALTSARYTADFNEVKLWGSLNGSLRNPYQTDTAKIWQTDTATAIWNRVADSLAQQHHMSLLGSARLLALMNIAQLDAVIAVWDAKNVFNRWRPITAIQAANDTNPDTVQDASWAPLLTTPGHQEYPSGHSGASGAAATVLASFFGKRTSFTVTSDAMPGASRSFTKFSDAVAQVADARVFAGFHFRFSCDDASQMGVMIANLAGRTLMVRSHGEGEGNGSDNAGEGSSD